MIFSAAIFPTSTCWTLLQRSFFARFACLCLSLCLCWGHAQAQAQSSLWQAIPEHTLSVQEADREILPDTYRIFALELDELTDLLAISPDRFAPQSLGEQVLIDLPMPNGKVESFQVYKASIMAPGLAAKYPMIQTYVGKGMDDPTATVRFDMTHKGFHAMVLSGRHSPVFIDPYATGDLVHYLSYYKKDFSKTAPFQCEMAGDNIGSDVDMRGRQSQTPGDCQLRVYRLAVSCTAEYTQYHGGSKADGLAAITTTMNRVNAIFERDLGVSMTFVPNMDTLIFVNPQTDPFDGTSISSTISANQSVIDNLIGTANYDIGHVFLTQLGGSAFRGSVCDPFTKADAGSGNPTPVGDPMDVEFVAHEMGHQFGARHTNNACNAAAFSSIEPGSGSTIMSPMSCNPSIQLISDPYFHIVTISEMFNYIMNGQGANCPTIMQSPNNPPTVDAGDSIHIVPISTPFQLTAIGTDIDGDSLTYCWEQMDLQVVSHPPLSTHESGPMFRSFEPVNEPYRYFPRLSDLVAGTNYDWEVLPSVNRDMNFRVTVRDNAIPSACIDVDDVELMFTERAGPFLVQAPTGGAIWYQGATETVQWDVARTDLAPVSCTDVDILLSIDGGFTYPFVLASQVPNDGYHPITAPSTLSSHARVMVRSSDNIFFNISNADFSVEEASSTIFVGSLIPFEAELCTNDSAVFDLSYSALASFNNQVNLAATGLPAGATASFSQATFTPNANPNMTIFTSGAVLPGNYTVSIIATSTSDTVQQSVDITVVEAPPLANSLASPANGARRVSVRPDFSWISGGGEEIIDIATNPGFGNAIVDSYPANGNHFLPDSAFAENTVYYWRVRAVNACGDSEETEVFCFQTLQESCSNIASTDLPVTIPPDPSNASSTISLTSSQIVTDVDVSLEILTSSAGGITADLISPSGTTVNLFDRPRFPGNGGPFGCLRDNIQVTLDDETNTQSAWLEQMCVSGSDFAVAGTYQPISSLSNIDGENTAGTWTLAITNAAGGGAIEDWSMNLCTLVPPDSAPQLINLGLALPAPGTVEIISDSVLAASSASSMPSDIMFTILSLPTEGVLTINGMPVMVGSTLTQSDINNQVLGYTNSNAAAQSDFFTFDVLTNGGGWIHADTFFFAQEIVNSLADREPMRLELFPNPTAGELTIRIQQETDIYLDIRIMDVHGRLVKSMRVKKPSLLLETFLNVRSLPAGPYQVLITDGELMGIQRFLKR